MQSGFWACFGHEKAPGEGAGTNQTYWSIILFHIVISSVENVGILDPVLPHNDIAKISADFFSVGRSVLPTGEADDFYNTVDIVNDSFYDDGCVFIADVLEQLRQSRFTACGRILFGTL